MLYQNILCLLCLVTLVAIAGRAHTGARTSTNPANQLEELVIKGALTYHARIALPPEASAIVELREGSTSVGVVIAEYRKELGGKQVPLPFELVVSRTSFTPEKSYSLRGAVLVDKRPAWVSNSITIDSTAGSIDVGMLIMLAAPQGAFSAVLACGDERVAVGYNQTAVLLAVRGETFEMRHTISGSGALYEAINDSTTTLWNKGDRTTVTVHGQKLPECGDKFRAILQSEEWVVENIDGTGMIDDSRLTLRFGSDGRVTGRASCNTYTGNYSLTGERIFFTDIAATLKACPPPLMAQEDTFFDVLRNVARFEITSDGTLILHTGDGRTIRARC